MDKIAVMGLIIEARGTITQFYENFKHQFNIDSKLTDDIIVLTLKGSQHLIQNHFYHGN